MRYSDLATLCTTYFSIEKMPSELPEAMDALYVKSVIEPLLSVNAKRYNLDTEAINTLVAMLAERFNYIRYTYMLYTRNTSSPVNQLCLALASQLEKVMGRNRFQLLMPSLQSTQSDYTGMDLNDPTVAVSDFILSEDQQHFIDVEEVFNMAVNDARLRHSQKIDNNGLEILLNASEQAELLAHCTEAKEYYTTIMERRKFIQEGTSLGALFQQLVEGLEKGDVEHTGSELDAANSASEAIARFKEFYAELQPRIRTWLNRLRANGDEFRLYWNRLTLNQQKRINAILKNRTLSEAQREERLKHAHHDPDTCVQTNGYQLKEILASHRDALFAERMDSEKIRETHISLYDENVVNAKHWFVTRMQRLRENKEVMSRSADPARLKQLADTLNEWLTAKVNNGSLLPYSSDLFSSLQLTPSIIQAAANERRTFIVTSHGEVYDCEYDILDEDRVDGAVDGFEKIPGLPPICQVALGERHTLFVTRDGQIYACGSNSIGQLGLGLNDYPLFPMRVPGLPPIQQAAAGNYHSLFLTSDGQVYACGWNNNGQLGLGSSVNHFVPQRIDGLPPIRQIAAGNKYSVFLSDMGRVYICGLNYDRQDCFRPRRIMDLPCIDKVIAGSSHTFFLSKGEVYACGVNYHKQLGFAGEESVSPRRITELPAIKDVATSNNHSLFLTTNGEVYACGDDFASQLGLELDSDSKYIFGTSSVGFYRGFPISTFEVNVPPVQQVAVGAVHSLFLTREGHLYGCGSNADRQLGLRKDKVIGKPELIPINYQPSYSNLRETLMALKQRHHISRSSSTLFAAGAGKKRKHGDASDAHADKKRLA